ncbi:MAG TPA: pro-sigmaK processing inhibitor BofA [Clostridiaceae bacterium]|nr:pro-sigmaK processing inhibitor BofA [Clostridiaceae bacterium]
MAIELSVIVAYAVGILLLFLIGRAFLIPIKILLKLIYNAVVGGIAIILINLIGSFFNFSLALNFGTALIVGFLGVPGVILLVILKFIM